MIRFIGNQFSGQSSSGRYRARNFEIDDSVYCSAGTLLALPEEGLFGVIQLATFTPMYANLLPADLIPDGSDVEVIVNETYRAANYIAQVLDLNSSDHTIWHP